MVRNIDAASLSTLHIPRPTASREAAGGDGLCASCDKESFTASEE